MKQIKLEVGKTYRNRRGKEVKIIRKNNTRTYPCRGNDLQSYTESGRFYLGKESEYDLIEEVSSETCHAFITPEEAKKVTATRYTFAIPDGMTKLTVEQVGNRIVVEMVPEEGPKAGDVMVNKWGSVYIFKEVEGNNIQKHYACLGRDGRLAYNNVAVPGRPATPEEAQPLFDALKKAGKRWNAETMQVEDVPEIERILEWVEANVEHGYYSLDDVAEAIEAYLKHREGEK